MKSTNNIKNIELNDLPFDQYSRQEIVRQIIEKSIRHLIPNNSLSILDLGGHKGFTKDFFPNDRVTILDVFDEEYTGYVKGDATRTSFKDNEFDVVVSFDTFEHIPKKRRYNFVSEAARISKHAFIIAAPFDNDYHEVSDAEIIANDLYKKIHNKDHPWLSEHIEYGIPTRKITEDYISKTGCQYINYPTNNLLLWLLSQGLQFNSTILHSDVKEVVDVSRFYNKHLAEMENTYGETYRQIYVGSSNSKLISKLKKQTPDSNFKNNKSLLEYTKHINAAYSTMLKRMKKDVDYLKTREEHLQNEYNKLSKEVAELKELNSNMNNKISIKIDRKAHSIIDSIKTQSSKSKKSSE